MKTFVPGAVARAEEINGNFAELQTLLDKIKTHRIAAGVVSCSVGSDSYFWQRITFPPGVFAAAPTVCLTPLFTGDYSTMANGVYAGLNQTPTTTYADIFGYWRNGAGKTLNVAWIAVLA